MLIASALQSRPQEDTFAKLLALLKSGRSWLGAVLRVSDVLNGGTASAVRAELGAAALRHEEQRRRIGGRCRSSRKAALHSPCRPFAALAEVKVAETRLVLGQMLGREGSAGMATSPP
jgi:hypothetical protein